MASPAVRRSGKKKKGMGARGRLQSDRPRIQVPSPGSGRIGRTPHGAGATPSWGRVARTLSIASAEEALAALSPAAPSPENGISPANVQKRKRTEPSTPQTPDANTGSPSFQHLQQEAKFLCDEVPHFQKVTEDIPMSQNSDVEAQTTFVFQLLKWILEYGKPAVHKVDILEEQAGQAQTELEEHRDGVRADMMRLDLMVRELNLENQELKDALFTAQQDVAYFESHIGGMEEADDQDDMQQIEFEETVQELEHKVAENDGLKGEISSLRQQLEDVRKSADELLEAYHTVVRERDTTVRDLSRTQTLAKNMEDRYQAQMAHMEASHEQVQTELQTVVEEQEHKARVQSPTIRPVGARRNSNVVAIATDYELNEVDMSMLEYSDGLQDGDFVSLQAEIDEYENSDDAWLSDSEDEYQNNLFADEFMGAAVSPMFSPAFESMKVMHEQFAQRPEDGFEEVKMSTGVERQEQELGGGMISMGVDLPEKEEFGSSVLTFGMDPTPTEEFGSASLSFGVDPKPPTPKEEFGSSSMSMGVDMKPPTPKEEFGSSSMSMGVDVKPATPKAEFGSASMSMGVDVVKAPVEEFASESMSGGVESTPKEEFGSSSMSTGVEVEKKPAPETQFETVTTSQGVDAPHKPQLALSTTTISVEAPKKRQMQLEFSTTVSATTIAPRDTGHFEMVRGAVHGLSPVSSPKALSSPQPESRIRRPSRARITAINVPRGQDEIVRSGLNFKNLLSHFTTLETKNPGKPKWEAEKAHELSNKWVVDGATKAAVKAKPTAAKASEPSVPHAQTQVARGIITHVTRTKFRTIKPKKKGYMRILKTTTLAPHLVRTTPNYFFCLDGLPSTTNVDRSEPDWQKNRTKEPLVPCIFFFESETRYRDFVMQAGGLPVREMAFQKAFAQFALGVIPLDRRTVGTDENQCLQQLGRDLGDRVIRLPVGMAEQTPASRTDPFLFVVGEQESHKFICSTIQERNEWLIQVTRLIRKRKETVANKRKVGYTHSTPMSGLYKMPIIVDESYTPADDFD